MWPQGSNCSFLIGISDYFEDIKKNESSLNDRDKTEITTICESLNKIIQANTYKKPKRRNKKQWMSTPDGRTDDGMTGEDDDPYSINSKVKKFFDWAQTYISMDSASNINWQQLVELFNFHRPDYAIPSHIDVTTYHATFLYKHCKEKGNDLMKTKKPKKRH
eukprot:UN07955